MSVPTVRRREPRSLARAARPGAHDRRVAAWAVRLAAGLVALAGASRAAAAQVVIGAPGAPPGAAPAPRVSGTVFDSVAARPLGGAVVQLVNAERPDLAPVEAETDTLGRFALRVPAGRYLATFRHPRLDTLGVVGVTYQVAVPDTGTVGIAFGTPRAAAVHALHCGAAGDSTTAVLLGYLRDPRRAPLDSGVVVARWFELVIGPGYRGLVRQTAERRVVAGPTGWFALCGLPAGGEVSVQGWRGADSTALLQLRLSATGVERRDLLAAPPGAVARLAGRVVAPDGSPIANARVGVAGPAGETVLGAEATTGADGAFALAGVRLGTRTVRARALGFAPAERVVDVEGEGGEPVTLTMSSARAVLDTIRVLAGRTAVPWTRKVEEFEARRRSSPSGYALDTARIRRANVVRPSDLLRFVPGVSIVPVFDRAAGRSVEKIRVRGMGGMGTFAGPPVCLPLVFLDRTPIELFADLRELDQLVVPEDVVALEFYPAASAPAQYARFGSCGSLVLTTRW